MTLASATAIARLPVKLFTKVANAGDAFNIQLLAHSSGRPIQPCGPAPLTETNLVLLGSILEWADVHSYVCRAALVRGPLTAAALVQQGWADPGTLGPAAMADALSTSLMSEDLAFPVIPHYVDRDAPALQTVDRDGGVVIDPQLPLVPFFQLLQSCRVILSSSLHGLIFAHAFGKPALWIEFSEKVLVQGFKFYDYYFSIGIAEEAVPRLVVGLETQLSQLMGRADEGIRHTLDLLALAP